MNTTTRPLKLSTRLSALGLLFSAVALSACEKRDPPQPKVAAETSVGVRTEQKVDELRADARAGIADAKDAAREVGQDVAAAGRQAQADVRQASETLGDKAGDALITTKLNAEFARDANLSAAKIDVDTLDGRVVLHGTAGSAELRDRATRVATEVKGVRTVENQLIVAPARM